MRPEHNDLETCLARGISRFLGMSLKKMHKILCNILHYYTYKITLIQVFLPADLPVRHTFALEFFVYLEVDNEWQWNILWTNKAHFCMQGSINTQNYRVWATENPFARALVPHHSANVVRVHGILYCRPIVFQKDIPAGKITCTVYDKH